MGVVQARALDRKVREAWVEHRAMVIVDNSTSFKTKVLRVANAVCRAVGAPGPNARIRRFVLPVVRPIRNPAQLSRRWRRCTVPTKYVVGPVLQASLDDTNKVWPSGVPHEDFQVRALGWLYCVAVWKQLGRRVDGA